MEDRWSWSLSSSGEFSVSSMRRLIDDKALPDATQKTRWVRLVPIKINVHAWKVKSNSLPTRFNISRRGILINSLKCGTYDMGVETVDHLFFSCTLVRNLVDPIVRWWNVTRVDIDSYSDRDLWIQNLRLPIKNKRMLEAFLISLISVPIWWLLYGFPVETIMGNYRTKEDDVAKISTFIFVTNFPELFSAKNLFQSCKQYGHVVNTFIPNKRSKASKRFGFVRFINVFNDERLVNNLCMIWNDRLKLHANIARFNRAPLKESNIREKEEGKHKTYSNAPSKDNGFMAESNSFAQVVKRGSMSGNTECDSIPAIDLDDECLYSKDVTNSLMGRVKDFFSLSNLKIAIANEGFDDINIRYMGELWVMLEFASCKSKDLFRSNVGAGSWFSVLQQAYQKKKQSEDPFGIYPLLDKQRKVNSHGDTVNGESLKYPPGFTPIDATEMMGQRRFKKYAAPRTGGSILCLMEEVVKVGQTMRYNMEGCVKDIMNIIESRGASSETKMESMELITINHLWYYDFDYVHSDAVVWVKTGANLLIVAVYAPHDLKDKCMLWDYLTHVSNHWDGEVKMMGDFNEVSNASLEEVPLGGCAYTWCHKSASKMSKLDRFLISENLMHKCPNICAITLDRFILDHRPILLRESSFDYGPTPFRFFHYWMEVDGFNEFVIDSWRVAPGDQSNGMRNMLFKLKFLKSKIREWINVFKYNSKAELIRLKGELQAVDGDIDNGNGSDEVVSKRTEIINSMLRLNKIKASEAAQKAKIKWSVEGDENSSFFHGMLNKNRSQLSIRGVMADGVWIENPDLVKDEFVQHFSSRFGKPTDIRASIDMNFPKVLSSVQKEELDCDVSKEELKRAVWDCGMDKSPGPDGFTFGFFRKFWSTIENDVYEAVTYFFTNGDIPKGCNSSFIALIPKTPRANMVKDFRPISLIGCMYKIIAKILTNRLVGVIGDIVNEVQSAFIADRQRP
ncbi:RNA-directed DNA polymerase, eukaryota [Tanacetum coccineum]